MRIGWFTVVTLMREPVRRLHWGCGSSTTPGWINADVRPLPGVNLVCDIRQGLSLPAGHITYCVSVHALQEIPLSDQVPVLSELHRVLKRGGVLRLCLPDLEKAVAAYQRGDRDYFLVPDEDARSLSGKFVTHILWYSYSRVMFTPEFIEELLLKAGFNRVDHCAFQATKSSWPEITQLDCREHESLFVEAVK